MITQKNPIRHQQLVDEIVTFEFEKYNLPRLGFAKPHLVITDTGQTTAQLYSQTISKLYEQIRFTDHIKKLISNTETQQQLGGWLKSSFQQKLHKQQKESGPTKADKAIGGNISYLISQQNFDSAFRKFTKTLDINQDSASAPRLLEAFAVSIGDRFPLSFESLFERLQQNDQEYWTQIYNLVKKTAHAVTKQKCWSLTYKDVAEDEVTTESYYEIIKMVTERDKQYNDLTHFINSVRLTCANKLHEYLRRENKNPDTTPLEFDTRLGDFDDTDHDENSIELTTQNSPSYIDIDLTNQYQIASLASLVLLRTDHPLRQQVVAGEEDKIRLLIDIAVNGLSYDQIIEERYGTIDDLDEKRKINNNLRQEYARCRKNITARLKKILEEHLK